jgi:predicted RND superfamily exporter protein
MFAYWDIAFNLSSITNLCLAVGFSVDYSAHISAAFSEQPITMSKQKRTLIVLDVSACDAISVVTEFMVKQKRTLIVLDA